VGNGNFAVAHAVTRKGCSSTVRHRVGKGAQYPTAATLALCTFAHPTLLRGKADMAQVTA